jgi:hypothetical protein
MFNFKKSDQVGTGSDIEALHLKVWKKSKQDMAVRKIVKNKSNSEISILIGLDPEYRKKWLIPIELIEIHDLKKLLNDNKEANFNENTPTLKGWFNQNSAGHDFSLHRDKRKEVIVYSFMVYPNQVNYNTFEIPYIHEDSDEIEWKKLFTIRNLNINELLLTLALCLSNKENFRSCFFLKVEEDFHGNIIKLVLELPENPTLTYEILDAFGFRIRYDQTI